MSRPAEKNADAVSALDRLVSREEVLQICFWYEGEGFGSVFDATTIEPFLNTPRSAIDAALLELVESGELQESAARAGFQLTAAGKKNGGRLFADSFSDFQKAGHGECAAGCCDGDDHSQCGVECSLH